MLKTKHIIGLVVGALLVIGLFSFIGCERIDAGHVGIKVNNTGGDKGISRTENVTGWVFYWKTVSKIYEFPTFQQHKDYDPFTVPSKGGAIFTVHPSFNYNVNPGHVADMFQNFRLTLRQLEEGYLRNALFVSLRETTNTFTVDSVLNNLAVYDAAVLTKLNEKLSPYFIVSTFTSGLEPDEQLKGVIMEKTKSLQNAIKIENDQKAITAQAQNDIIGARRDSTVKVMAAEAEAKSIMLKQNALKESPQYVELIKAQAWNGVLPQYMLGNGTGLFLNMNK